MLVEERKQAEQSRAGSIHSVGTQQTPEEAPASTSFKIDETEIDKLTKEKATKKKSKKSKGNR